MEGKNFCGYLANDQDRANFEATIARTNSHAYCTDVVVASLKDTLDREFSVHIHTALFHNRDCEPRYLIGIAENEERERDTLQVPANINEIDGPAPMKLGNSVSCCSSSEVSTEVDGADWLEEISFSLCVDGGGIIVTSSSPGFTTQGGPVCEGQDFQKWIPPKDLPRFNGWLQRASDDYLRHLYGNPYTDLVLKTPSCQSANFTCRSSLCTIDAVFYNAQTDQLRYHVTLHAAALKRKGKKKKTEDKHNRPTSNEGGSSACSSQLFS